MIVDTHLLISKILYNYLSNQMNFRLNRLAFAYGNIKPDFNNKDINHSHTLDESLHSVNKYSEELVSRNISIKEFSMSLGVICHFVCDYFCIYHREGNEKKGIFEHLVYELILHVKLLALLLRGKLKFNNYEMFENSVEAIVMMQQERYNSESKCLTRDISYALRGASQVSKLIICSSQLYFDQNEINISENINLVN